MNTGKCIRLGRILNRQTKKTVMVPMDHGITMGPVTGLEDARPAMKAAMIGGANAVIMHKGMARACFAGLCESTAASGGEVKVGLVVHLSASTSLNVDPDDKTLVTTPLEALRIGADAVSVHVNVGSEKESRMMGDLGRVARDCEELGLPLLAMMYPRGKNIHNQYDPDLIAHACRVGAELGADLIKTNYTGDPASFRKVVAGCPVPVLVAGGLRTGSDLELLEKIGGALDAGAAGVAIGRNVFMHEDPASVVRRICAVVHEGLTPAEAMKL